MAPAHALALDVECEIGHQAKGLPGPARLGGVAVAVVHRPGGGCASIVEGRLADDFELDLSLEALDRPHEHVVGIVVPGRARVRRDLILVIPGADRQSVKDAHPAGWRLPGRSKDIRPGLVRARGRMVDPERRKAEEAGLSVEEAAEDAR